MQSAAHKKIQIVWHLLSEQQALSGNSFEVHFKNLEELEYPEWLDIIKNLPSNLADVEWDYEFEIAPDGDEYKNGYEFARIHLKRSMEEFVAERNNWYDLGLFMGSIKGKEFRFRIDGKPRTIFNALAKSNWHLDEEQTQDLIRRQDGKRGRFAYDLNEVVKDIRNTTGLNTSELSSNGGVLKVKVPISLKKGPIKA